MMSEKLKEVDQLLSAMTVSGDNVILLANARSKLAEAYNIVKKEEEKK